MTDDDISKVKKILNEYFYQQRSTLPEVIGSFFSILPEHPKAIADFLIELSKKSVTDSSDNIISFQLNNLYEAIQKIAVDIDQKYSDDRLYYFQKIVDLINFLPDEIKFSLIKEKLLLEVDKSNVAGDIISHFSTNELINIFNNEVNQNNIPLTQLKDIFDKIRSLGDEKKSEIISALSARHDIREAEKRTGYTIYQKEEVEGLSLYDLENKVSELVTYTKEEIEKVEKLSTICSKGDIMSSTTKVLLEVLPLINEVNIYLKFVDMLQDFLELYLVKNKFDISLWILKVFKEEFTKRQEKGSEYIDKLNLAIREAGSENKIYGLILFINDLEDDSKDILIIKSYLELLGEEAINVLLTILGKEEKRIIRKLIVQILIDIGQNYIELFAHRLTDERWYLVRNIISIFGEIRNEKAIAYISTVLNHSNPRVRAEAIRSLGLIGGEKSSKLLISSLKDRNIEFRRKAVRWLGEIGEPVAVPYLAKILRKIDLFDQLSIIKEEIIYSLEKINSPEIIPVLEEASRRKWYQFGNKSKNLCYLAKKTLEKVKNKDN